MIPRLLVSALIGALATIVVAWVCTILPLRLVSTGRVVLTADREPAWFAWSMQNPTMVLVTSELITDPDRMQQYLHVRQQPVGSWLAIPRWARPARIDAARAATGRGAAADAEGLLSETAAGWPWPALRAAYYWSSSPSPGFRFDRGIYLPGLRQVLGPEVEHLVLPTAPIWRGFLDDAALYGAIAFPLISMRHWVRQRRSRLGLCEKCAYPVKGLNRCPECGTPSRPQAPRTTHG